MNKKTITMPKQSKNKKDISSKQAEDQGKKDMPVPDKVEGKDEAVSNAKQLITNFVIGMNDSDHAVPLNYADHFYADLETGDVNEMYDDVIINTIYDKVVFKAFKKMLEKYEVSERRERSKLFNKAKASNELHRAFYFKDADGRVIIDRKKNNEYDIIRKIYDSFHTDYKDNTMKYIVFDFNDLLVNMVDDEDKLYEKIITIWDEHHCIRDNARILDDSKKTIFVKNQSCRKFANQDDADQDDADQGDADQVDADQDDADQDVTN